MNLELMQQLSDARGVSGQEAEARRIILQAIDGHVEDVRVDALGNVLALKPGRAPAGLPRVMVTAHVDEIGFVVRSVDGEGLLRFYSVGGVDARILPGLRVCVGADAAPGVIMWKPIHLGREQRTVPLDNLRIDVGARDRAEAGRLARPGDMITFPGEFTPVGDGAVRGKALDNRAGCALLVELLQGEPLPCDLLVAFTCQEEIGLRGAQVAGQALQPDVAIALDVDFAVQPGVEADNYVELGKGPALPVGPNFHPALGEQLRNTARRHEIPLQHVVAPGATGTDAWAIQVARDGVPTALLGIPLRNMHSPVETLDPRDVERAGRLLAHFIADVEGDFLQAALAESVAP